MKRRYVLMTLGAALIAAADQMVKAWTVRAVPLYATVPLLDGVVHLTHLRNTGMAFSLLQGGRWLFLIFTAAFLALAALAVWKDWLPHPLARAALTMLAGGAVGNLIDRIRTGAVVDMIELEFIRFAVFNVADIFVTLGGALLLVWAVFFDRKGKAHEDPL